MRPKIWDFLVDNLKNIYYIINMKTKTLLIESAKYGNFEVLYDAEDEDKISKYKWGITKDYNKFYVRTKVLDPNGGFYPRPDGRREKRRKSLKLHQLIMETPKGMHTDHINGNSLDNRKENLRICTASENGCNRGPTKNNTSGYKGIFRYGCGKKWQASIKYLGKNIHIGCFKDKKEAARAYDKKAIELHGEFAYTNFPIEDYQ